jgi:hypothetical protein
MLIHASCGAHRGCIGTDGATAAAPDTYVEDRGVRAAKDASANAD